MNKDSLEMTDADRAEVRDRVAGLLPEDAPIVISHGTDTMVETGLTLEKSFPDLKVPIILTGAMTPLGFEGSDGLQNLTESLFAARLLWPGVFVVMHGQVFPVGQVRKDKDKATFVVERPNSISQVGVSLGFFLRKSTDAPFVQLFLFRSWRASRAMVTGPEVRSSIMNC